MHDRIKKLRKALDLTQRSFAERIGMKSNTIATYEMGRATPSDPAIKSICREFNVSETWLRTGEGDMFTQSDTFSLDQYLKQKGCTSLEKEVIKAYFELDFDTRQKVFDHFRARLSTAVAADAGQQVESELPNIRPMIPAAARSSGVTEIEEISPDEISGGGDIP